MFFKAVTWKKQKQNCSDGFHLTWKGRPGGWGCWREGRDIHSGSVTNWAPLHNSDQCCLSSFGTHREGEEKQPWSFYFRLRKCEKMFLQICFRSKSFTNFQHRLKLELPLWGVLFSFFFSPFPKKRLISRLQITRKSKLRKANSGSVSKYLTLDANVHSTVYKHFLPSYDSTAITRGLLPTRQVTKSLNPL